MEKHRDVIVTPCQHPGCPEQVESPVGKLEMPAGWFMRWDSERGDLVVLCPRHRPGANRPELG
jgi:hypothetical protein